MCPKRDHLATKSQIRTLPHAIELNQEPKTRKSPLKSSVDLKHENGIWIHRLDSALPAKHRELSVPRNELTGNWQYAAFSLRGQITAPSNLNSAPPSPTLIADASLMATRGPGLREEPRPTVRIREFQSSRTIPHGLRAENRAIKFSEIRRQKTGVAPSENLT
jgi:hypothetical protein